MSEHMFQVKPYQVAFESQCLQVFRGNVPKYFAPNEESDFVEFLTSAPSDYSVVVNTGLTQPDNIVGCFGLTEIIPQNSARISWIMLAADTQGKGVGNLMMTWCIERAKSLQLTHIDIAASHLSAPFFEKFDASALDFIEHGWGQNMHRINMVLRIL